MVHGWPCHWLQPCGGGGRATIGSTGLAWPGLSLFPMTHIVTRLFTARAGLPGQQQLPLLLLHKSRVQVSRRRRNCEFSLAFGNNRYAGAHHGQQHETSIRGIW